VSTKERLASVLKEAGLHAMSGAAAAGRYDDFESEHTTPIYDLVQDLRAAGREDLARRAIDGEWDASREEAEAWFQREGRHLVPEE
jgi:hypothetical protein